MLHQLGILLVGRPKVLLAGISPKGDHIRLLAQQERNGIFFFTFLFDFFIG
jgi:hypothetical protein